MTRLHARIIPSLILTVGVVPLVFVSLELSGGTFSRLFLKDQPWTARGAELRFLPEKCVRFENGTARVDTSKETTILWHWDAQPNHIRQAELTRRFLIDRTDAGTPVGTHFALDPGKTLQLLPMWERSFTQGRLSNDAGIYDASEAVSRHYISIETTGIDYDTSEPPREQTERLLNLTLQLMRQYRVSFKSIRGHYEISRYLERYDPGREYMNKTRIRLAERLISSGEFELLGEIDDWNFYGWVRDEGGKSEYLKTQDSRAIFAALGDRHRQLYRQNH